MKILLTGRTGQVGWELERALAGKGTLIATDRRTLDLADPLLADRVREEKPDVIVNAAAYTAVDKAESEPGLARKVNALAPGVLAEEAKRTGALLIHFSTDYVFDGAKASAYTEEDATNPLSVYGRTKLAGENAVRVAGGRHLILRTSWVYAPRGRNFFLTIAKKARAGERLRVVADQTGVPTESAFIADITRRLLERGEEGTVNVVPSGATTWHGFACAIVEGLRLDVPVAPIATQEYPAAAARPKNSVLDCAKLARLLGVPEPWQAGLARCLGRWNPS